MSSFSSSINRFRLLIAVAVVLLGVSFIGPDQEIWAQINPGAITQTPETTRPERGLPERERLPELDPHVPAPTTAPGGATLFVRNFELVGAEMIHNWEIQAVLAPYKGRHLTLAQIEEAANQVTALYQSRGYLLAQAYIPQQDARDGDLKIAVVVGRYGHIYMDNNSLVRDGFLARSFGRLKQGEVVKRRDLERRILLTGDLPGAKLPNLTVGPGQIPGTADFNVQVDPGQRITGYLTADNQGSRYTGKYRFGLGLDVNSLFRIGDKLSFNGMTSDKMDDGILNGRLAFSTPLNTNGLRLELAASHTTYELNEEYRDLEAIGWSDTLELGLQYPIIRSQDQNLWIGMNMAGKRLKDEIRAFGDVTDKRMFTGTGSLRYEKWSQVFGGHNLYTAFDLGLTMGHLRIPDRDQRAFNQNGANTVGDFSYLNLSFFGNYAFTDNLSANLTLTGQRTLGGRNLDGNEQFIISGPNGIRAYRETISGDNGYIANLEMRYQLPGADDLTHSIGLFGGTARTWYQNGDYVLNNGTRLSDAGLGYYVNYGRYFGRAQFARIVGAQPDDTREESRNKFLVQVGLTF